MFSSDLDASSHRAAEELWHSRKGGIEQAAQRVANNMKYNNKGKKREMRGA